ncbi:MAG: class I SAM-dependent methyltransferase [Gemmatimonadaceae bacterium]
MRFGKRRAEPAPIVPELPPSYEIAYDPELVPPLELMRTEGIDVLEEWFRWGEEWSMLLRVYAGVTRSSSVLEIGCGLGRIAFPLRFVLSNEGSYDGFEIGKTKVEFLEQTFHKTYPHFRFVWANVHNTYYNPEGEIAPRDYSFPYADESFDVVFAASVFTHILPEAAARYFRETARVLKPGGRVLFSCFLLDNYLQGRPRPLGFGRDAFNFDHSYGSYGDQFAIVVPDNPEQMTAYRSELLQRFASDASLSLVQPPVPGFWSGASASWIGMQDLLVLTKPR